MNLIPEPGRRSAGELKPYPTYKDFGNEWLGKGKVPAHWAVHRLRNVCELRVSNVDKHTKKGEVPIRLCNYVDVYRNNRIRSGMTLMAATATADEVERFRLRFGDVLITKDSEAWNDIGVPALVQKVDDDVISGYHLALLRADTGYLCGAFLFCAIECCGVAHQFHVRANGVTRYGLSHEAIKSIRLPVPPRSEQTAIVCFLDHVDRRIRRYIRAKEKLIALLEEQKQAVIHEAIAGKVDVRTGRPYPAYKNSGVMWLGQVPRHWSVRRLGNIGEGMVGLTYTPDDVVRNGGGTLVLRASNIREGRIVDADNVFVRSLVPDNLRTQNGDVLLCSRSGSRGLIGKNARIDAASAGVTFGAFMTVFRSRHNDYLHHVFNSRLFEYQSGAFSTSTINQLTLGVLRTMNVPWPDAGERAHIASYLSDVVERVTTAQRRVMSQTRLAEELRARLIADVVTGKLDVREAAAGLGDVDRVVDEGEQDEGFRQSGVSRSAAGHEESV